MIGKFPRIIIGYTNIVHKVLDSDANEEEENMLIDIESQKHTLNCGNSLLSSTSIIMLYVLLGSISLL